MRRSLLIPLALCAAAAIADPITDRFGGLDTDHNGSLSVREIATAPHLQPLDTDADGTISLDEAKDGASQAMRRHPNPAALLFQRLDRDGNDQLTDDELPRADWMKRIDLDGNGVASREEAMAAIARLSASRLREITDEPLPSDPTDQAPPDLLADFPIVLKASDHQVGRRVPEVTLLSLDGNQMSLVDLCGAKGLMVGLFTPDCPMSGKLAPEMNRLERDLSATGIAVCWVCPIPTVNPTEIRRFALAHKLTSPLLIDTSLALTTALRASTTTETFLIDSTQTLLYRGAIHDQYGLSHSKDHPTQTFLRDAIAALLAGTQAKIMATTAPGCALDLPQQASTSATVFTYHRDIARILQNHCIECHRQDGLAPFSLESYHDVIDNAGMIRRQVERGIMPPWFADAPTAGHLGFSNDRSLSESDRTALLSWLDSDRPIGDSSEAPAPRSFPTEWQIPTPNAILTLPKPVPIKAEGAMPYVHVVVPTDFGGERWVKGYEIQPTARSVVHHVIVKVHPKGERIRHLGEGQEGYWAAYVPGNASRLYPPGFAKRLPQGAQVSFQIHYTPNGKATEDQLRMGLLFADEPPQNEVKVLALANPRLKIPAGAENHTETFDRTLPSSLAVTGFMPHMHNRGTSFRYEAILPDGSREVLLNIPRYDFNWQLAYDLAQPRHLPKGTQIHLTAGFDNSANNPANPDPTKTVRWGPQTWDEMMIGYIEHYVRRDPRDVAQQ